MAKAVAFVGVVEALLEDRYVVFQPFDRRFNECFEDATVESVDASEILRSPPGMVIKQVVNNGIFHLPTSTGAFPPDFWLPSGKNLVVLPSRPWLIVGFCQALG